MSAAEKLAHTPGQRTPGQSDALGAPPRIHLAVARET